MTEKKVSILIPTLHRPNLLRGAIKSVGSQTYENIEIIIVNDDNEDQKTRKVIKDNETKFRLKAIHNSSPQGISASRNQAAKAAEGEYLCILDDDDRWEPKKIEKQINIFENSDSDLGVVYTGGDARDQHGNQTSIYHVSNSRQGDIWPEILTDWGMDPHSGHMIKKRAFNSIGGFDESLEHGEDWDLSIRLAKHYQFVGIPEILTHQIKHSDNVSNKRSHVNQREKILLKHGEDIFCNEVITNKFFSLWHRRRGRYEMREGNSKRAIKEQITSFGYQPDVSILIDLFISLGGKPTYKIASSVNQKLMPLRRRGII